MPGLSATQVMDAILSVMPLDDFVPEAAFHMEVVGDPTAEQPIFAEFRRILAKHEGPAAKLGRVERFGAATELPALQDGHLVGELVDLGLTQVKLPVLVGDLPHQG